MSFRAKNPVTIVCEQCGQKRELKSRRPDSDGAFCSHRCSAAWHRENDMKTIWGMMELTRLLWKSKPLAFDFKPREFPGMEIWRRELNATSKWLREIR
jgi:hypothetical protein